MPLRRFQLLLRRAKIFSMVPGSEGEGTRTKMPKTYQRLEEWSNLQQQALADIYVPGSHIAVDECIMGFTGKSTLKTTIPNKPTPTGFKVWAVAESGLILRWNWHIPGKGPVGVLKNQESAKLNPTQRVVTHLV